MQTPSYGRVVWMQPRAMERRFELRAGDHLVGTLRWEKVFSHRAIAETEEGRWCLERRGFFRRRVAAVQADSGIDVAQIALNWKNEGALTLADERVFHWRKIRFWRYHWALVDEWDNTIFELRVRMRFFRYEAEIIPHAEAEGIHNLVLLMSLGWYLGWITIQDTTAATAAAAS